MKGLLSRIAHRSRSFRRFGDGSRCWAVFRAKKSYQLGHFVVGKRI